MRQLAGDRPAFGPRVQARRLVLAMILVAAGLTAAAPVNAAPLRAARAPTPAPTTPTCAAGKAPVRIEAQSKCVAASKVVGAIGGGAPPTTELVTTPAAALLPKRLASRVPRLVAADARAKRIAPRAGRQLSALVAAALAKIPAGVRARRAAAGPTITLTQTDRGATASASQQVGGAKLTVELNIERAGEGQVGSGTGAETTVEAKGERGEKVRATVAFSSSEQAQQCPNALGAVTGQTKSSMRRTTTTQIPGAGASSSTTRVNTETSISARVGNDARLDSADLQIVRVIEQASSGLVYTQTQRTSLRVNLRGAAPTATPTSGETQVRLRAGGGIANQAQLERELATQADQDRAGNAADEVDRVVGVLRKAEERWRTPNACAKLTLDPTSPKDDMAPKQELPIRALLAAADGDKVAAAAVDARGLTGKVAPEQRTTDGNAPVDFTGTAADEVSGGSLLLINFTATSRAGIAEATFDGRLGIPRRWRGAFSDTFEQDGLTYASSGTVTFIRDDDALRGAGLLDGLAGYRVEQVDYRQKITGTQFATGCIFNFDGAQQLTNTPVRQSALTLDLQADANGTRAYSLVTSWSGPPQSTAITCPPPTGVVASDERPEAALTTAPGPRPRINGLSEIAGQYTDSGFPGAGRTYTWSLRPAA